MAYTTFGASPHHRRTDCQRRTCRVMICLSTSRSSLSVWLRPRAYAPHNRLFLSLFAVSRQFSQRPCAVVIVRSPPMGALSVILVNELTRPTPSVDVSDFRRPCQNVRDVRSFVIV